VVGFSRSDKLAAHRSRFEALHAPALTPLVGRREEIELLLRRWQQGKAGEGRVVLLAGESGTGKSRELRALKSYLAREADKLSWLFLSERRQLMTRQAGIGSCGQPPNERDLNQIHIAMAHGGRSSALQRDRLLSRVLQTGAVS
jgi:type I site-specific restriction endonuclease